MKTPKWWIVHLLRWRVLAIMGRLPLSGVGSTVVIVWCSVPVIEVFKPTRR